MEHILIVAAALHAADGVWEVAVRLHGAAAGHMRSTGRRLEPIDIAPVEPFLAQARSAMSAAAYAKAFDEGRALDQRAVLALAADCLPHPGGMTGHGVTTNNAASELPGS